jgi:hypothetical protein
LKEIKKEKENKKREMGKTFEEKKENIVSEI